MFKMCQKSDEERCDQKNMKFRRKKKRLNIEQFVKDFKIYYKNGVVHK